MSCIVSINASEQVSRVVDYSEFFVFCSKH